MKNCKYFKTVTTKKVVNTVYLEKYLHDGESCSWQIMEVIVTVRHTNQYVVYVLRNVYTALLAVPKLHEGKWIVLPQNLIFLCLLRKAQVQKACGGGGQKSGFFFCFVCNQIVFKREGAPPADFLVNVIKQNADRAGVVCSNGRYRYQGIDKEPNKMQMFSLCLEGIGVPFKKGGNSPAVIFSFLRIKTSRVQGSKLYFKSPFLMCLNIFLQLIDVVPLLLRECYSFGTAGLITYFLCFRFLPPLSFWHGHCQKFTAVHLSPR